MNDFVDTGGPTENGRQTDRQPDRNSRLFRGPSVEGGRRGGTTVGACGVDVRREDTDDGDGGPQPTEGGHGKTPGSGARDPYPLPGPEGLVGRKGSKVWERGEDTKRRPRNSVGRRRMNDPCRADWGSRHDRVFLGFREDELDWNRPPNKEEETKTGCREREFREREFREREFRERRSSEPLSTGSCLV